MREVIAHLPGIYWRLLLGLALMIVLAPFAEHRIDLLRAGEIGLSLAIVALLIDFGHKFHQRYRLHAPTAATPAIVWTMVAAYIIALAGNTLEVLENYREHLDAVHPPLIFGFFSQLAALAWVVPFLAKLYREADRGAS
jgi:hypothetical protein